MQASPCGPCGCGWHIRHTFITRATNTALLLPIQVVSKAPQFSSTETAPSGLFIKTYNNLINFIIIIIIIRRHLVPHPGPARMLTHYSELSSVGISPDAA